MEAKHIRPDSEIGTLCQITRTKKLRNSTNSPHTLTALPPPTTEKRVTRLDASFPNQPWNMPMELSSRRKKHIVNLQSHRRTNKCPLNRRLGGATSETNEQEGFPS